MPKSSIAIWNPSSWRVCSDCLRVRSGSVMAVDSVTSIATGGGGDTRRLQRVQELRAKRADHNCRGDTLTASSTSSSGLLPLLRVICRHVSSIDPVADGLDRSDLLGERDEVAGRDQVACSVT